MVYSTYTQPSQLLDLLLDVNESKRIPQHLHYSLATPPPKSDIPDLQADGARQRADAERVLELFRKQLESGEILEHDYEILVAELKNTLRKAGPVLSLPNLERTVSHTSKDLLDENLLPEDIRDEEFSTYLDAAHEDTYLAALDATLDGVQPAVEAQPPKPMLSEITLKNPVSIYNWLRVHKPDVFVQEGGAEKGGQEEKETKANASSIAGIKREGRSIKRPSVAELLDDDGNVIGGLADNAASKPKRKREDDAYRPKGGGSSKKRKKSTGKAADVEP